MRISDVSQITVDKDMMSSCKLAHNRYKTYLEEDEKEQKVKECN